MSYIENQIPASATSVGVNGTPVTNPNFSSTTPAAPAGFINVTWQVSGSNISGYVPISPASKAAIASNWLNSYDAATGLFTATQPTFTDLSSHPTTLGGYGITDAISANLMTTLGDIIYENATPTPARLAGNITTTKMYLSQTGNGAISAVPAWAQINYSDITGTTPTPPSGSVLWSSLGNAAADLTLANGAFNTTFNQTSAVNWTWANTTAATSVSSYPSPGLGATNVNSAIANSCTLNINPGDCVVVFVNVQGVTTPVITDNATPSNTYAQVSVELTEFGHGYAFVCLSATHTATSVSSNQSLYNIAAATFIGVSAIGATAFNSGSSGSPASSVVTTTANTSLVISGFNGNFNGGTIAATLGSLINQSAGGTVVSAMVTQQVATSGTVTTNRITFTGGSHQENWAIELKTGLVITNKNSPILNIDGTYWTGVASAVDSWTIQDVIANAVNGASTLTIGHSGSSGLASVSLPNLLSITGSSAQLNFSTDNSISRLGAASLAIGNGTAGDFSGKLSASQLTLGTTSNVGVIASLAGKLVVDDGTMQLWVGDNASFPGQGFAAITSSTNGIQGFIGHTNTSDGFVFGSFSSHRLQFRAGNINHWYLREPGSLQGSFIPNVDAANDIGSQTQRIRLLWSGLGVVTPTVYFDTTGSGANDTTISRLGAASLAIGNGTASDFSGSLKLTGLSVQGALTDGSASVGTAGQVLTSTGTKVAWKNAGGSGGGQVVSYVSKAGSYNLAVATDYFVSFTATATASLPLSPATGTVFVIKNNGAGIAVTVQTISGGALVDGSASQILTTQYSSINVIYDGTNWQVW